MRDLVTAADIAILAIDNLVEILTDARRYLEDRNDLAAWGTLIRFEEAADDLKAAIRLHKSMNRRRARWP